MPAPTTTPTRPLGGYFSAEIDRMLLASGAVDRANIEIAHNPP